MFSKIGRNDPCPCGSGNKYKRCCRQQEEVKKVGAHALDLSIPKAIQAAIEHHQAGHLPRAEAIYRQILQVAPNHPDALHSLGVIAYQVGKNEIAVDLINKAINISPSELMYCNLGNALQVQGQLELAVESYQKAISIQPDFVEAHSNLGNALQAQGRFDEAVESYRRALSIKPDFVQAHGNLGNALQAQGKFDEAVESYRRALLLKPDYVKVHGNLGNALQALGKLDGAVESYQRALSISPDLAEVHSDLGNALQAIGKLDDAVECYRRALSINPNFADAYSNLGNAFQSQGRLDDAIACHKQAISIKPDLAEAYSNLGSALKAQGRLDEAIVCHKQALSLKPGFVRALSRLGNTFLDQGRLDEAIACYRRALLLMPNYAQNHSNLLLAMQYLDTATPEDIFNEHQCYAECHEMPLKPCWSTHRNSREPERRIKVGYVSPDFRRHSVAYFIESVIRNHDKTKFEIFCYFNSLQGDSLTLRFMSLADHWVPCKGMTDVQLAEKIRADGIDILVDLAGHTADNRLLTFARKPSPVQVTYLGYPNTTGLTAMDYRLTDIYADPPGADDELYTEKLVRLPKTFLCFCPPEDAPEVQTLPAISNGFVTFGSFNTFPKITPAVIGLWSRILLAVPNSRMLLKSAGLDQPGARNHLLAMFEQHGVSEKRLTLLAKDGDFNQHLSRYHGVDICLDPFPYNGTTTTCEALWMGVPTITLCGNRHSTRVGASLLANLGLEELIAKSHDEYLQIAESLATETQKLVDLRSGLRHRLGRSPLLDGAGLTQAIEKAYQKMWSVWLSSA